MGLPIERGSARRRVDAAAIVRELTALVARRGLERVVRVQSGCAGAGPNVDVRIHAPADGRADDVAVGWKTYVYSLSTLRSLADVIDENLPGARATRRAAR